MTRREGALGQGILGLCRAEQGGQCGCGEGGAERWLDAQSRRPSQPWEGSAHAWGGRGEVPC